MKIVSAEEMREIDRATTQRFGIPSLELMEHAGAAVADFVLSHYGSARTITVLCGKGNNGGDGFVAARILHQAGREVSVVLLAEPGEVRGDAAEMLHRLPIAPQLVRTSAELQGDAVQRLLRADLVLDAVLGTGFKAPATGLYEELIAAVNAGSGLVVAVDIPSGAEADATSELSGPMRADAIVTFTAPRPVHLFGSLTSGHTIVAAIGSPAEAVVSLLRLSVTTPQDMSPFLAPRAREANKGSYGHVLVIGGAVGKAGAAAMAGFAALRAGAGLATVATPKSVQPTVAGFHPELMTEPLEETEIGTLSLRGLEYGGIERIIEAKTVLAVGPGISRHPETTQLVRTLLARTKTPMVLDADGLNAFAEDPEKLTGEGRLLVITPHPGEMARLLNCTIAEVQSDRLRVARAFAAKHHCIVVLKGHRTLIVSSEGEAWVNPTGNAGMATGGTGDVLTGMIAGCMAQFRDRTFDATVLAVYLHGLAGDIACNRVGEKSLVATDLIGAMAEAIMTTQRDAAGDRVEFHA